MLFRSLEDSFGVKITTIDPLEEQFQQPEDMELAKLPMFDTVMDYVKNRTNSGTKSDGISLLLDWPSPNNATYGVDAINAFTPVVILIRYASCGAAGSKNLQSFLKSCDCPSDGSSAKKACDGKYSLVYSDQTVIGTGGGFEGKTIDVVVLKRN